MRIDLSFLPAIAAAFLLVFARVGTMLMLLPGLGEQNLSARMRLTFALVLAAVLLPLHRNAYHIDPAALGLGLQAMIAVQLNVHSRGQITTFVRDVPRLPGVVSVFHVAGSDDYLLHIAVRDSDALRDFVLDHLTSHPAVRHTETSLIFAHLPGTLAGLGLVD